MACSLEGGLYKIFSVGNHGQDADLNGGLPMAPIVGYENNTYSSNMVWNLTNVNELIPVQGMHITLTNAALNADRAYASVDGIYSGAALQGNPNEKTTWILHPIQLGLFPETRCQYQIWALLNETSSSRLAWLLPDSANGTPITLAPTTCDTTSSVASGNNGATPTCDPTQTWTFTNVGNVARRGINGLD